MLEDFERRNVEVISRFVEQEDVGLGEHEARNENASLFAAGEFADRAVELIMGKEEAFGVGGDVDEFAVVVNGIGIWGESMSEELCGIELIETLALLVKVDDAEVRGTFDGTSVGGEFAAEEFEEGRFA